MLAKNLQAAVAGQAAGGYTIDRSLRFNSADSAYLSRTPGSAGNRKTWTWSGWVKRSNLDTFNYLIDCNYASNYESQISFNNSSISIGEWAGSTVFNVITTPVYRDVSAWYHIVVAADTTQATASNRIKVYVNGVQVTSFSTANYPSQNYDIGINTAAAHNIGRWIAGTSRYFNGYMADINFIDGQALTPADFGEYNATTGVWSPIAYAGTYGTNGFHLSFSDNSSTTALGTDSSGNSNNWTANNFSVTAGAGNDSLVDTPTPYGTDTGAGGEVGGNYCTLNPLANFTAVGTATPFNGNLDVTGTNKAVGTFAIDVSDKWYFEVYVKPGNSTYDAVGWTRTTSNNQNGSWGDNNSLFLYAKQGEIYNNGWSSGYSSFASGDTIGVGWDSGTVKFYKNGTLVHSYASGVSADAIVVPFAHGYTSMSFSYNFGQRPFAYTAPSGFKALCTTNLPAPDVVQGDTAFNTVLYTGTGSSLGVTGVGFQPDFTWIKSRSAVAGHIQVDAIRGATKYLQSNNTNGEGTDSNVVASFGADGFTVGSDATTGASGSTYVAWNWKAGGSGVSNTDGTITSTVSANPTAGISVVTYSGTGSNASVGHGLGVTPSFIVIKNRSTTSDWQAFGSNFTRLKLNQTAADAGNYPLTRSSTTFAFSTSLPGDTDWNASGNNYVAYCFAPVEGFSAMGRYTGNGSTDGPFVYTGFRPAFVMIKGSTTTYNWTIRDDTRSPYNVADDLIYPNTNGVEEVSNEADILSNGFKLRTTGAAENGSGQTYIYMAFAENPFKYSLAR